MTSDYYIAEKWALRPRWQLRWLGPAWRLPGMLQRIDPFRGQEIICFRGRPDQPEITGPTDMGPPPRDRAPNGRYNRARQPVLYLADSKYGVAQELRQAKLCLQKFRIRSDDLRLADLTGGAIPELVSGAFDAAESSCVDRHGRADYVFSQLLADFVRDARFDGMIVPGVRGTKGLPYRNVVIFASANWQGFCGNQEQFERIDVTVTNQPAP